MEPPARNLVSRFKLILYFLLAILFFVMLFFCYGSNKLWTSTLADSPFSIPGSGQ